MVPPMPINATVQPKLQVSMRYPSDAKVVFEEGLFDDGECLLGLNGLAC